MLGHFAQASLLGAKQVPPAAVRRGRLHAPTRARPAAPRPGRYSWQVSPSRAAAIGLLLLVALVSFRAHAADTDGARLAPLPWREPAPLARLFLQLPFETAEVLTPGALAVGFDLLYSNSLLLARSANLDLDVDVETAQPTVRLRYGLGRRLEAELGIPVVVDYGGFLDRPI